MENPNYKNENTERKYLNTKRRNQFLNVKNSILELEIDFVELRDIELKDREVKTKWEIEELFFKSIIVFVDEMDRIKKKRNEEIKTNEEINTWCDWLTNYILKSIRKSVDGFKNKLLSLFKTNTPRQTVYGREQKLSKPRKQDIEKPFISEENKIK